jgi:methionyl-tRNA formyltransferase
MKIVYMGSPEEVLGPLRALAESAKFKLIAVVSQPPKEQGRGKTLQDTPVAKYAKDHQIKLFVPVKASEPEFLSELKALAPDVIITAAYGQMLSEEFLTIANRATINIHPSLLPKYRGATPVPAALLAGDQVTGVSILFTVKRMDAGAVIVQKEFPVLPHETSPQLTLRLFEESTPLLFESLECLKDPSFVGVTQDESKVVGCKKISKLDGILNWHLDAKTLVQQFRAYFGWPGLSASIEAQRILITGMTLSTGTYDLGPGEFRFDKATGHLIVGTMGGSVEVSNVKPAGKNEMSAAAFFNGCQSKGVKKFDHPTVL